MRPLALLLAVALTAAPAEAAACGGSEAEACRVTAEDGAVLGRYRLYRPASAPADAPGAVIFLHGWRATAAAMIANRALRDTAERLGAVLVAPQGSGQSWSYPGSPEQARDEFAFFDRLRADLTARHGVREDRLLVAGFSMGASMVWWLACARGSDYAAFAPMAGAFWEPLPERCADPAARLHHLHGETDRVVPIGGRRLAGGFAQGDVWASFAALGRGWSTLTRRDEARGGESCARWRSEDGAVERWFCRHSRGHVWRGAWIEAAWRAAVLGAEPVGPGRSAEN